MKIDRRFISASSAGLYDRPPAAPSAAEHGPDGHQIEMHTHERIYMYTRSSRIYGSTTKQIQDKEVLNLMSVKVAINWAIPEHYFCNICMIDCQQAISFAPCMTRSRAPPICYSPACDRTPGMPPLDNHAC
jgi:hypothetical protein